MENSSKQTITSFVIGIISNAINLIMTCSLLLGGPILFGGLLLILPFCGLSMALKARKINPSILGIISIILNIVALLGSLGFLVLGFVGKLMA